MDEKEVDKILTNLYKTKKRCRIFYGDPVTGLDWCEQFDVLGAIGRSCGVEKVFLLLNKRNSLGGRPILTDCVVKITVDKKVIYQVENYQTPIFDLILRSGYWEVTKDGEVFFRDKDRKKCENFISFMRGERNKV